MLAAYLQDAASRKADITNLECWFVRADDERKLLLINGKPVLNEQDDLLGYRGVCIDITEKKRAENRFLELSSRYKAILAAVPDIVIQVDENKVYTWANKAGYEFFGDDVIGKEASYYFVGEQDTYEQVQPMLDGDESIFYVESWQRRKDGEVCLLAWWCRSLKDDKGQVIGAISTARDITERKQASDALKQSEYEKSLILNSTSELFAYYDTDLRIRWANKAAAEYSKMNPDDLVGLYCYKLWHQRETPCENCPVLKAKETRKPQEFEMYLPDGSIYHLHGHPVFNDDQEVTGMIEFAQDITERKNSEEAIRASEKKYRELYESMMDAYAVVDAEGEIIEYNSVFINMLGYSPEEILSKSFWDITPEKWHKKELEIIHNQLFKWGYTEVYEKEYIHKDGSIIPVEIRIFGISGKNEDNTGYWGIIRDISERKQVENALRESEERYRRIAENADDVIYCNRLFPELKSEYISSSVTEVLGYTPEDFYSDPELSLKIIYPDDKHALEEIITGKTDFNEPVILRWFHKDGKVIYTEHHNAPVYENGVLVAIDGIARDITKQHETQKILRTSEQFNKAVLDNSPLGISVRSVDGTLISCNDSWKKTWGFSEDQIQEFKERKRTELKFDSVDQYLGNLIPKVRQIYEKGGNLFIPEVKYIREDGSHCWVSQHFYAIMNDMGGVDRVVILTSDITNRIETELALSESEKRFRTLTELAPVGIYLTDKKGNCLYVNTTWQEMSGLTLDEALGDGWVQGLYLDDHEKISQNWYKMVESKGEWGLEYRFADDEGKITWVYGLATPQYDNLGEIIGYIGINLDITERKNAIDALKKSEELNRALFECSTEPIILTDLNDKTIRINPAAEQLFGYNNEDTIGKPFPGHLGLDVGKFEEWKEICRTGKGISGYESVRRDVNGNLIPVSISVSPIRNSRGELLYLSFLYHNIFVRKQAEEALHESEKRFRTLQENIPIALYRTSVDGRFLYVNKEMVRMFGYDSKDDLITRLASTLYHDKQRRDELINLASVDNQVNSAESKMKRKDGSIIWVSSSFKAIKDDQDEIIHFDGILQDITERKKVELALRESEEKFRVLSEEGSLAVAIIQDNNISYVNDEASKLFGFASHELIGKRFSNLLNIVSSGDRVSIRRQFENNFDNTNSKVRQFMYKLTTKTGSVKWVEIYSKSIFYNGEIADLLTAIDITERRLADEALRASEERYRAIWENSPIGISIFDREGRYRYINPSYCKLFGYTEDELINERMEEKTIPGEELKTYRKLIQIGFSHSSNVPPRDGKALTKSGDIIWVRYITDYIRKDGKAELGVCMVEDISNRRAAEEELKENHLILQEKHIALNHILQHIEEEKRSFRDAVVDNIEQILLPSLGKMVKHDGSVDKIQYNLHESTLKEMARTSGGVMRLYNKLSPREIEISNLIRSGASSKDIAETLFITIATVKKHREQIRKKLGITNKNVNLTSFLKNT